MNNKNHIKKIKNPKILAVTCLMFLSLLLVHNDYIRLYISGLLKTQDKNDTHQVLDVVVSSSTAEDSSNSKINLSSTEKDNENDGREELKVQETQTTNAEPTLAPQALNMVQTLITVHNLISKFLQNIDCSKELKDIRKLSLPNNLTLVLEAMQNYNDAYLVALTQQEEKVIFPTERITNRIIGRFIKIEKITSSVIEKEKTHQEIVKNIHIIEEYFYSPKFLDRFNYHD